MAFDAYLDSMMKEKPYFENRLMSYSEKSALFSSTSAGPIPRGGETLSL
jgi:hypothetical protein